MPTRRFLQLDVFAPRLFEGNPLAVIVDGEGLDTATMQRIARWTNLSETTFLLPPSRAGADYRVRIFTPRQELPFAGHPSVGSAYAAIEAGRVAADKDALVQECAAGLLPVRIDGRGAGRIIHVQAPAATIAALEPSVRGAIDRALGGRSVQQARVDNGPRWIVCDLHEAGRVRGLAPDMPALAALCLSSGAVGVCVFGREREGDAAMAVRAFCPADGIPEDPVTGSANAAIAACLDGWDLIAGYGTGYVASQGREVGRDGRVEVRIEPATGRISIGGACRIGVRGTFDPD